MTKQFYTFVFFLPNILVANTLSNYKDGHLSGLFVSPLWFCKFLRLKEIYFFGLIVSSKNESDKIVSICIALVAHP